MTTQNNLENINFMSLSAYNQLSTHETDELYFVPVAEASTTTKGQVQLATSAECSALSDSTKAITPASLSALMATKASVSSVSSAISTHDSSSSAHSTLFAGKQDVRSLVADTTSTTATISSLAENTDYTFSQALTSLTISAVTSSMNESTVTFTTGSTFSLVLPSSGLTQLGSPVVPSANQKVVMAFRNGFYIIAVVDV